jgi:hypothetical protein
MIDWEWTKNQARPEEILDAARTIRQGDTRIMVDLTPHWVEARRFLEWANAALSRGGDDAWDAAAGWAKRAVCRRMDGLLTNNHLGNFLGESNRRKAEYLGALQIPGLQVIRDMIIDPRNDIEHAYASATEEQARRAWEVADLFLRATETEAASPAIETLGWHVSYSGQVCTKPGKEFARHEFSLRREQGPMLLVDGFAEPTEVLVLHPKDADVAICGLAAFSSKQIIDLNGMLRAGLSSASGWLSQFGQAMMRTMRTELRL